MLREIFLKVAYLSAEDPAALRAVDREAAHAAAAVHHGAVAFPEDL